MPPPHPPRRRYRDVPVFTMVDDVTIGPGNCRDGAPAPMDTRPTCQCPEPSRTQPGVACQRCDPRSLVGGGGCPLLRMSPPPPPFDRPTPPQDPPEGTPRVVPAAEALAWAAKLKAR